MPVRVLITTNIRSLGELMQQALQETGRYRVELADGAEQALECVQSERVAVAILDFGAVPDPIALIADLRDISPNLRIVAMPSSADEEQTVADQSVVDAWLSVPFYLPNLIETLAAIVDDHGVESIAAPELERLPFPSVVPKKTVSRQPAPEWLQDVNRVAQHLTRLSLESTAQAALITRGSQLWAYAGQLPQPAAEELARAVGHYWAHDGGSDLARFIRLDATNSEYMMYATSLGGDYVLALAFETEMPFTEMRTHAGDLARKLSTPPVDDTAARRVDSVLQQETASEEMFPVGEPAAADFIGEDLPPIPTDWRPDQDVAEGRQAFFEDLLASMDIPQPNGVEVDEVEMPTPAVPIGDRIDSSVPPIPLPLGDDLEAALDLSLAKTRPTPLNETETLVEEEAPVSVLKPGALESDTSTLHNLTYACVLVPRLPQHHLVGDLATFLAQWVTQLSLAFGWRLEHLAIRPDYLHWISVCPPNSSPGMMVHNIRQETSQYIFSEIPRLERENPSGEFWASGYLIVNGRDPFSRQMVQEFIGSVRTRQGVQ
ncbi:MAG: transposase [Anaerolineales bacterium]|nr:transposase [Anaerolineales bacterium]